jgi:hypothetical protein
MPVEKLDYEPSHETVSNNHRQYTIALVCLVVIYGISAVFLWKTGLSSSNLENRITWYYCICVFALCCFGIIAQAIIPSSAGRWRILINVLLLFAIPLGTAIGVFGLANRIPSKSK